MNVVKAIDTRQLHTVFIEWMKDAVESISGVVAVDGKQAREKWSNLQGIGVIFSETEENGKKSKQAHYFIYSCKGMMAEQILEAKRSHWSIENKLQWVLDMQYLFTHSITVRFARKELAKLKEVWYDAFCIDQLYWQRYRSGHNGADSKSCYQH